MEIILKQIFNEQGLIMNDKLVITPSVVINSMRDNGYKNAAYALAEIVDNSIQAEASYVRILSYEFANQVNARVLKQVNTIAILDNGKGMSPEELHFALAFGESTHRMDQFGMGKFGMGLPNASISQCKRVDVWSWQNKDALYHSYLDVEEIANGSENIPYPEEAPIPQEVKASLTEPLPESGTLVVWTKLDRLQWSTSKTLFRHSEMRIGRMYRNFINSKQVTVRFHSYEVGSNGIESVEPTCSFKANDPMYLMKNDTFSKPLPDEFEDEAFFALYDDFVKEYSYNGEMHEVRFRSSYPKRNVWDKIREKSGQKPGNTVWGSHCRDNFGLSVMRAGREIDLVPSFITKGAQGFRDLGRFCGLEIEFPPSLDKPFGLLNNKQQAVNLKPMDRDKDAKFDGFEDSTKQFVEGLKIKGTGREILYDVTAEIKKMRENIRSILKEYPTGNIQPAQGEDSEESAAAQTSTEAARIRAKDWETEFDTAKPSEDEVVQVLIDTGQDRKTAEVNAGYINKAESQFHFDSAPLATTAFFDVTTRNGFSLIQINENHLFYDKVLSKTEGKEKELLELVLGAWARLEHETTSDRQLQQLNVTRAKWGEILETFYEVDER